MSGRSIDPEKPIVSLANIDREPETRPSENKATIDAGVNGSNKNVLSRNVNNSAMIAKDASHTATGSVVP
jgi:hypothetical protein